MKEPDWDSLRQDQLIYAAAVNAWHANRNTQRIYTLLCWATGVAVGLYVHHVGWRGLLGGWLWTADKL
ncbi:hypothetical protein [Bosea sp. BIWAKO-01]|uniref:hypothetical protein n=1 Tax=Bosea sp. BIWAKO-01 TaxID=506668 RepID=UPI00085396C0|nr:hypothetical protein [Bosea sp. BIWAKO-01]